MADIELPTRGDAQVEVDPEGIADVETPILAASALSAQDHGSISACDRRSSIAARYQAKMYRIWGKRAAMFLTLVSAVVFAGLYFSSQKSKSPMATMLASKSNLASSAAEIPMGPSVVLEEETIIPQGRHATFVTENSLQHNDGGNEEATSSGRNTVGAWEDVKITTDPSVPNLVITTERPMLPQSVTTFSGVMPSADTTSSGAAISTTPTSYLGTTTAPPSSSKAEQRETPNRPRRTPYGTWVGEFKRCRNMVSGDLFVVSQTQLYIANFTHDGTDADFWGGTDTEDLSQGLVIPYPAISHHPSNRRSIKRYQQNVPRLGVNLFLELPSNLSVSSLRYFSLRGRQGTDLGTVEFPSVTEAGFEIPSPVVNSAGFVMMSHGVTSGPVTLVDERTADIDKFFYDGRGEDAFFFGLLKNMTKTDTAGTGRVTGRRVKFFDEKGKGQPIRRYEKESLRLRIPDNMSSVLTWGDFQRLSVSTADGKDFGVLEILLPERPPLPPSVERLKAQQAEEPLKFGVKGFQPTISLCSATFNRSTLVKVKYGADVILKKRLVEITILESADGSSGAQILPMLTDGQGFLVAMFWGVTLPATDSKEKVSVDQARAKIAVAGVTGSGQLVAKSYVPIVELRSILRNQQVPLPGAFKPGSQVSAIPKFDLRIIRAEMNDPQERSFMLSPAWDLDPAVSREDDAGNEQDHQPNMDKDLLPDGVWIGHVLPDPKTHHISFDNILVGGMFADCRL